MFEHRPYLSLGAVRRDWLDTRLHFRLGECGRADHAPLGALYVWNDDAFAPHSGFDLHAHRCVEIVTWVRSGAITYEDDAGNRARLVADSVQTISAGAAIHHTERNQENVPARLFPDLAASAHAGWHVTLGGAYLFARLSRRSLRHAGEWRSRRCTCGGASR
ncbi:pirin family protein [Paraburkholderia mimosarum]